MPPETPAAFGMHANAEIGARLREGESFCSNLLALQARPAARQGGEQGGLGAGRCVLVDGSGRR
jgi:hypothetical protein